MPEPPPLRVDIGFCHPSLAFLAEAPATNWNLHSFCIAQDDLGPGRMLDSCVATPARYLLEMFRRLSSASSEGAPWLFLFNPLLLLRRHEALVVLATLHEIELTFDEAGVCVVCDKNDIPLGYLLPRPVIDDARYLMLLSCSSTVLDATALEVLYDCKAKTQAVDVDVSREMRHGFFGGPYLRPNELCCRHARELLASRRKAVEVQDPIARRACRDAIDMVAFVSHHAGDVLFASIAAQSAPAIFQGLVVHHDYAAICKRVGLKVAVLECSGPVPHRGTYDGDDPQHFIDTYPLLPPDRFYVYARTSRDYNTTCHHLIDHYAFALGAPLAAAVELDSGRPAAVAPDSAHPPRLAALADTGGILMHFNAGWPLKTYPLEQQRRLVCLLQQGGYAITLLDAKTEIPGCRHERFESLQQFESLLAEHQLLVGMDSFPAHFASLVPQIPTICLFSSTHPVHSRTMISSRYRWLCHELDCSPCRSDRTCPRFGGETCRNFSSAEEVRHHVDEMLAELYPAASADAGQEEARQFIPRRPTEFSFLPSIQLPQRLRAQPRIVVRLFPKRLDYRRAYRGYRLARSFRSLMVVHELFMEYVGAVRERGFRRANELTWNFLQRLFERPRKSHGV
jgi:hypothetical protein